LLLKNDPAKLPMV